MHTKCKKTPHGTGSNPVYKKNKQKTFFVYFFVSFLISSIFILWLVHVCFISLSTFFQPYNYGQLSGNSAFGQVAFKWFSNS